MTYQGKKQNPDSPSARSANAAEHHRKERKKRTTNSIKFKVRQITSLIQQQKATLLTNQA